MVYFKAYITSKTRVVCRDQPWEMHICIFKLSYVTRKPIFLVFNQVGHKRPLRHDWHKLVRHGHFLSSDKVGTI